MHLRQGRAIQRLIASLAALACVVSPGPGPIAHTAAPLMAALEAAREDAGIPFRLRVDCTDRGRKRSLDVMRGFVAVWGNERQVILGDDDRDELLNALVDADFASFAPRYGETPKADRQEAPLRISCLVRVVVQDLEKTSVQILDGDQSDRLLGLARRLLDRIEPLAAAGVTAASLEDGLAKLADGTLAPEVLNLRLLTLPAADAGQIFRIDGGRMSKQRYAPGKAVGTERTGDLAPCQLQDIVSALRGARFWELPVNLHEVRVLSRRKTVIARPGFTPASAERQAAFAGLVTRLAGQPSACDD
jgi:hypothetical protein